MWQQCEIHMKGYVIDNTGDRTSVGRQGSNLPPLRVHCSSRRTTRINSVLVADNLSSVGKAEMEVAGQNLRDSG